MSKRLLYKTLRAYLLYSVLTLAIAAPVFYYAIQRIYINEADDTLVLHKKEFLNYFSKDLQQEDIPSWNKFNRNVKIEDGQKVINDSLFFSAYYDTLDDEVEPYRELNFPIIIQNKPYTYSERINLVETEDLLKNIAVLFFTVIGILLVGLFLITKTLSQNLWKPFYETLKQIEDFQIDKTRQPEFLKTDIEEFQRLNRSIENLIERNTLIYKSQREFIENAAHELQTPLAVFQAKIDNLIQRPDITREQAEQLESLTENVFRLNRLNKNLLLLSKIDNDSYSELQNISMGDCVQKNLAFFIEQAEAKRLTVTTDFKNELLTRSNPVLAEILISNLFLNAIRHNVEGGEVVITIQGSKMSFSNTGLSKALDPHKLYNRFSKTNASEQGTGLGLSIVKKIADINQWMLQYEYQNNLHSFEIFFNNSEFLLNPAIVLVS